jgi:hypothetical protein
MQENFVYDDPDVSKLATQRRLRIMENMDIQTMLVRGHDKQKNAVWLCLPRKTTGDDVEGFLDYCIYMIERASACTEAFTQGESDAIVVVVDARNSSAPSVKACKAAINILQTHYTGRLKNLVILDLPYLLQAIYNVVKPFLDPDTRSKFIILKGERQKELALASLLDKSQVSPNLVRNGKLGSGVDGKRFLHDVPFHCLYDCVPQTVKVNTKAIQHSGITFKASTLAVGVLSRCGRIKVSPV